MASADISPQSKVVERTPSSSKLEITDEMMLKAVSMVNEKDKVDSKMRLIKSQLKGDTTNLASRPTTSVKPTNNYSTAVTSTESDLNGNAGKKGFEENCPFDIVCAFLQAVMQKRYKEALNLCKTVLLYEPDNGIAKEFRDVLDEMVKEERDSGDENEGKDSEGGDKSESSEDESSLSSESNADSDESSDETSSSSSGISNDVGGGGGDASSQSFGIDDFSSGDEEDGSGEASTTSGSSGSSSSSSSTDSSTESEDASDVADLLMAGVYGVGNNYHHHDDNLDMDSSLVASLQYELDQCFIGFPGADSSSHVEDLGEVKDNKQK